ncbi:Transcriptional regulator PadR-like family protein [uncultured archaeon]|nr:Transcriptional regulator PadR-like family protein [uncultured archaeon]
MPLKRLKEKTTTENLWLYILALLIKKPVYAYEIRDRISEEFGFDIGNVTAYIVLYRLEKDGYVTTEWKSGVHERKYYRITPKGREALDDGINHLKELVKMLSPKKTIRQ